MKSIDLWLNVFVQDMRVIDPKHKGHSCFPSKKFYQTKKEAEEADYQGIREVGTKHSTVCVTIEVEK